MHKIILQSPIVALEVLIHLFGAWIGLAAVRLLALLTQNPTSLAQMLIYHANTRAYCEHLVVSLLLLVAFSYLICRCAGDHSSGSRL